MGKTCSKLANGLNFYDLKKKLTPRVVLTLPWGYIHVYYHYSQTSLLEYISGLRGAFTGPLVFWYFTSEVKNSGEATNEIYIFPLYE